MTLGPQTIAAERGVTTLRTATTDMLGPARTHLVNGTFLTLPRPALANPLRIPCGPWQLCHWLDNQVLNSASGRENAVLKVEVPRATPAAKDTIAKSFAVDVHSSRSLQAIIR